MLVFFLPSIKIESQNRFYEVAYLERLNLISSVLLIAFRAGTIQTSYLNSYNVNFERFAVNDFQIL